MNTEFVKLDEEQKVTLEQGITFDEMTTAVKSMPTNKTPGCDGLPSEFYKKHWESIGKIIYNAIVFAQKVGKLHLSARRGVICIIPKKNRNPLYIKNW